MTFKNIFPAQFFENVPQPSREAIEKALQHANLLNVDLDSANLIGVNTTYSGPYLPTDSERPIYKLYTDGYAEFMMGIFDVNGDFLFDG